MSGDEQFDLTKKKKKKKKMAFDFDETEKSEEQPKVAEPEPENKESKDDDAFDLTEDFSKLKKKKGKKKPFDLSDLDNALPQSQEEEPAPTQASDETAEPQADIEDDLNFDLPTRKKKRKKGKNVQFVEEDAEEENEESETAAVTEATTWHDTDRDYTYQELLTRVFEIMREKNPEFVAGEKRRFVMKPPQVSKAGAKKTAFANFSEICKTLHRQPKHLLSFLLAELGTSGSVDGSNSLIIKGRFHQKQIETVLRRYIKEYVTCHTCKSPETILQRDTRLYFLQCELCGSRCSVASIKSGFQAVTGKRAALRAKTT